MSLMGLDIGTTGCKCSLFTEDGVLIAASYREYSLVLPKPGYFEFDPHLLWKSVQEVIEETASQSGGDLIKAISVSSFGETAIPIAQDGSVLGNGLLYTDIRGFDEALLLEQSLGKTKVMALAGVPLHPMFTVAKMMWMKRHEPQWFRRVWKFLLIGDYIVFRLTGMTAIDYTLASRTMAFNITTKKWETEILRAAELDQSLLSEPVASGEAIGRVTPQCCERLGLKGRPMVVAGGHDQACAALGAGILREGQAIDGIGTVECIAPTYSRPVVNETMLRLQYNCAPHVLDGHYLTYAFNFTGGSLLKWFRNEFGYKAESEAHLRGMDVYNYLNLTAPIEPTDLVIIPHFAGSGTPHMKPEAKGLIYGLTFQTTAADVYRACMEGVTYEMRYNLECLKEAGIAVDSLRAVGGGAKSDLWLQLKADIMNRTIERLNISEAGTIGTVILAGRAVGAFATFEEAAQILVKPLKSFYPHVERRDQYEERYEKFKRLSNLLSDW
ncbi:FGGY-family carbohydrate kinase [Paenibacillus roseipurpureus]|uniref:FGGY-family carbohydrate kinase n=1 Tax=Paenibacillus roseopurpureus TaxID=2918901 RepID=A0AA96LNY0_9BACL|nr:FGGY-family carbohydrate kinase [Paenibacillus sp. MBLB1832]WNR45240.1 FGGY-family carbohydrate kinase [Paenibacillus sp. MBLB1832]